MNKPLAKTHPSHSIAVIMLALLCMASSAFAASQTWTNAPVSVSWTNINNWVGKAVPGALNPAANALSGDTATFNSALSGGIGGVSNPINNDTNRDVKFILFDTANCGSYVIGNANSNILQITSTTYPGGNVTINPTVVNPQVINAPLYTRLASSSSGGFSFINNSTTTTATLSINSITNSSANSRPMTFFLDGSNTGANTIAHIDDVAGANGAILVTKQGSGTWVLSGANDLPQKTSTPSVGSGVAAVTVTAGKLVVQNAASLGAITVANLVVTNTGTLQIDGVTLNNNGITLKNGGTVLMNGSATIRGVTLGNEAATSATLATKNVSDVMTVGNAANQPTGGAVDTILHVAGPGTVLLSQSANYAGKWSVDTGSLQVGNASGLGAGANLNIAAGAIFDVSPVTTGSGTYSLGTAAISANGTGTTVGSTAATIKADASGIVDLATGSKAISLTFSPTAFSGDTTHPALYVSQGTLSLGGNFLTVSNTSVTPLSGGTYRLIQQASGSVTDGGGYGVSVIGGGIATGNAAIIQVSGGNVDLLVFPATPNNLVWTGDGLNNYWDTGVSADWLNGASPSVFNYFDNVTFNGVGSTNPTVNVVGTVLPTSVTVDTSVNDYTFSGTGHINSGAKLTKVGTGTLLVQIVNTYSGGTVVSNGTFRVGVNNAIPGTGPGDVAVSSPGVIDLNNNSDTINALNGTGTVDNQGGGAATLTVGNNNNNGTFTGVITNTAGTLALIKAGSGTQTLTSSNSFVGGTTLSAGTLAVANDHALGSGDLTVNAGTLDMKTNLYVNTLAGTGGSIANNSTTTTNTLVVQGTASTTYSGVIADGTSGKIALTIRGANQLELRAANTYTGGTIVGDTATLALHNSAAASQGGILMSNGTTLNMAAAGTSGDPSVFPVNNVTIPDNSAATFTSANTANGFSGLVIGGSTATNIIGGTTTVSFSPSNNKQFQSLTGVVQIASGASLRFSASTLTGGGDLTTFDVLGSISSKSGGTIYMGALTGSGTLNGGGSGTTTYIVGINNGSSTFSGTIAGSTFPNTTNTALVKAGTGTLTLSGLLTYSGGTTISNGVLVLQSALDSSSAINLISTNSQLDISSLGLTLGNGANQTLSGSGTVTGNLTVGSSYSCNVIPGANGSAGTLTVGGAVVLNGGTTNLVDFGPATTPGGGTNDLLQVNGNLTLNGTVTVSPNFLSGGVTLGQPYTFIKYTGTLTGDTNNLALDTTTYGHMTAAFSTSTPGAITVTFLGSSNLVWVGDSTNSWQVGVVTNWFDGSSSNYYGQYDTVKFDNTASNFTAVLVGTLMPNGITVNSDSNYVFNGSGSGRLSGSTSLTKAGTGTLTLTNVGVDDFSGATVVSNGVLNTKSANALSQYSSLEIKPPGTVQLGGYSETIGGLSGAGAIDNNGAASPVLTIGGQGSGVWSGTISNSGTGGISLVLNGTNNLTVSGVNQLNSATASRVNNGSSASLVLTNSGLITGTGEFWIGCESAVTGKVVVAGGSLVVSNWLVIGRNNTNANGTLVVNSGTVQKTGLGTVNLVVGSLGATGNLTVNGGQVLNNGMLWVGEAPGAKAVVNLNGGLLQATQVRTNYNGGAPDSSVVNFNGGTLQASAASANFLAVYAANVQNGGLTLDDGGYVISVAQPLLNAGSGGLTKQGAGTVNLDAVNTYTGPTVVNAGTLGGTGTIAGALTNNATLAPGDAGVGTLTVNGNLTLKAGSTNTFEVNGTTLAKDVVVAGAAVNYGGVLKIVPTGSFTAGQTFQLFSGAGAVNASNFAGIVGSAGSGLGFTFTNGVLTVVTTLNPNPPQIQVSVSGSTMTLGWPTNAGWLLQSNSVSLSDTGSWFNYPADGSASVTSQTITVDPAKPNVFYRMVKP